MAVYTYTLLECGIFLLSMYKVEENVESASENQGKEQTEACQVRVPLRAV